MFVLPTASSSYLPASEKCQPDQCAQASERDIAQIHCQREEKTAERKQE